MNKDAIIRNGFLLLITNISLMACDNSGHKETVITEVIQEDSISIDEMEMVTYSLPSPLQIAAIFKKSGLKFQAGLTSPMKDPSICMTTIGKALTLGVYSADLSYALLNKQNQTAMEYMKLSRQIAGQLGMGSVYEVNDIAKRFEKNIGTEDSVTVIISELQMEMDFYLDENKQQQITAIAFAGAWIESMYIASVVNEQKKDKALNYKFSDQMSILESIINALKANERKEPALVRLIDSLKPIKEHYEALSSEQSNGKDSDDNAKMVLRDEGIASLSKEIAILRSKFIKCDY